MERGENPNRIGDEGTEFKRQREERLRRGAEDVGIGTWEVNLTDRRNQLLCHYRTLVRGSLRGFSHL